MKLTNHSHVVQRSIISDAVSPVPCMLTWRAVYLETNKCTQIFGRKDTLGRPGLIRKFNPLNAELNPICHSLILLGGLPFMGPCIVSIFQYIFNKMQRYTVYLYLETALHVSSGTSTHHQERIQLYSIWYLSPTAH
jgi:hypothetical protein